MADGFLKAAQVNNATSQAVEGGEIYEIAGSGHNDGFLMVYLPREKILIEGDAYTPVAVGAPPPALNPYSVNCTRTSSASSSTSGKSPRCTGRA